MPAAAGNAAVTVPPIRCASQPDPLAPPSRVVSTTACAPELPGELVRREAGQFRTLLGEIVGVIGCNGMRKRTLLKILSRSTEPPNSDSVENMV